MEGAHDARRARGEERGANGNGDHADEQEVLGGEEASDTRRVERIQEGELHRGQARTDERDLGGVGGPPALARGQEGDVVDQAGDRKEVLEAGDHADQRAATGEGDAREGEGETFHGATPPVRACFIAPRARSASAMASVVTALVGPIIGIARWADSRSRRSSTSSPAPGEAATAWSSGSARSSRSSPKARTDAWRTPNSAGGQAVVSTARERWSGRGGVGWG